MTTMNNEEIRRAVRTHYSRLASGAGGECCSHENDSACCSGTVPEGQEIARGKKLGYSVEELTAAPQDSNLGLGCGNPQSIASIAEGETVLDLGSGAGFDCFLASRQTGPGGRVIGVDMTPVMIEKARRNAVKGQYRNVEFRRGEIEQLPVEDASVDVIISNCVINLSPDKQSVFNEAFRVLKPGGRVAIADIVARILFPKDMDLDVSTYCGCISGAPLASEVNDMLVKAGFVDVAVTSRDESRAFIKDWIPGTRIDNVIVSASIEGRKPPTST